MPSNLLQFAAPCCALAAVICAVLAIRHARKQSRVDHHISELERQLRERRPGGREGAAPSRSFG